MEMGTFHLWGATDLSILDQFLTNEVSKLMWFNFFLYAVLTFEQWLIVLIL